ncbi:hypothetical protein GAZ87_16580 [Phocaeicola vulgatus]|uniref:Uncharacterized protein n=1 Tax=Phocaeicola vulgatus TaxID=821 RepID=A0A415Q5X0_PHOVU|nr:hypothetical protein GAZ81_15605 [Phocaeicola vulgatus]KAB6605251.1 hypothetical protein GAZ67_16695 [Phocaeicola vulgatus]KAB6607913.1 hypothetical protein GAZ74_16655 [Phocaeicola vulgatus]KAB6613149.1 hypothetical protein GAY10_16055 [Phocaeicola vulgatus]KAB6620330.1 hypothetical protein GAZ87_16580 [Phocaeicola vulgatus]
MREKYDFCLHIEYCFYLLLMRIGPVFLMGFCISVITVRLHRKFHIKDKDVFLKEQELFQKQQDVFDAFLLVLHNMAKYLVFLSEVSASPQTSCSSAFRLKDIHDKILQPKKIFQRDRVSDVVLVGFLSVFGFTFIHLLTTAERKNYAVEGSRCINLSAGMPMNRTFAERLKLLKDFWGHSSREGYFSSKDGYAYQKEGGKTLKTCRKMSQFL